jgi:hypothetical protein
MKNKFLWIFLLTIFVYRSKEALLNFLHVCMNHSSMSPNVRNVSRAGQAMAYYILKGSAMHSTMKAYFVNTPLNFI